MGIVKATCVWIGAFPVSRLGLAAENFALRQQVAEQHPGTSSQHRLDKLKTSR